MDTTAGVEQRPGKAGTTGARLSSESFLTLFMVGVLLVVFALACTFVPNFYLPRNILNLLTNYWYVIILGIGVSFLLITGNFDMSVGGNVALTGVVEKALWPPLLTAATL